MVSAVQQSWALAGCPSGQREQTVNLSRKLRRFEPFTRHTSPNSPLTCANSVGGLFVVVRLCPADTGPRRPSVGHLWANLSAGPAHERAVPRASEGLS